MSLGLVAYGSSDESEDEVIPEEELSTSPKDPPKTERVNGNDKSGINKLATERDRDDHVAESSLFNRLPQPRTYVAPPEDDPSVKISNSNSEILGKREKAPVKFLVPSLADFKDVDEEMEEKKVRKQPSSQGSALFGLLPAPGSHSTAKSFVPHVLTRSAPPKKTLTPSQVKKAPQKSQQPSTSFAQTSLPIVPKYDSSSDDEDDSTSSGPKADFFSLSNPGKLISTEMMASLMLPPPPEELPVPKSTQNTPDVPANLEPSSTLTSTVMNLPRDQILLKNQAEVGPKLPVPEQEYHLDSAGNVAFDEKAIEYLCGKRGTKRKNELIQGTNIIDINGDDIKPDEREWLVKALTEEPVHRPVSLSSAGPSGVSKKKHQITYLAHQAKAMEIELQNQWAANRMARNQTKSKYGF